MATEFIGTNMKLKTGLAEMLKGGVIMDVINREQAIIAEKSGAVAVMALERVPSDIRRDGGVARMSPPEIIEEIMGAVSIPVMAKARIGHFAEAMILEALGVDYIDESEVLTPADEQYHIDKMNFKTIYGIKINNFEDYWNNVLNTKKRNMYTKSIKNNLNFKLIKLSYANLKDKFLDLYNFTMDKVSAKSYYYFNENYFKTLEKIENSYLAEITNSNNKVIGCSIIFIFGNYIHYHLSCNDNSMNCITDFLLINIVKELGKDKLIILGGGLSDNDDLSKFKRSLSNETFTYNIYKNIINKNIYDELSIGKETNNFFPAYR